MGISYETNTAQREHNSVCLQSDKPPTSNGCGCRDNPPWTLGAKGLPSGGGGREWALQASAQPPE